MLLRILISAEEYARKTELCAIECNVYTKRISRTSQGEVCHDWKAGVDVVLAKRFADPVNRSEIAHPRCAALL